MDSFHSRPFLIFAFTACLFGRGVYAQQHIEQIEEKLGSEKVISMLSKKASGLEEKIDKSEANYLSKFQKEEAKLKKKIWKRDTTLAKELFEGVEEKYAALKNTPQRLSKYSQVYSGHLDSLTTALKFLRQGNLPIAELEKTLSRFSSLQNRFNQTESVRKFLSERKQLLKENLERLGMLKELKGFQKQAYYYSQQVRELKEMWEDPTKLEQKLLEVLSKTEPFKDFFRNNSQLASLFSLPGTNGAAAALQGLQTRASVQQSIQDRFGSSVQVQQLIQQNIQAAQGQISELQNKLSQYGSGSYGNSSGDIDLPKDFKPNNQKTKTFLQRLEYGANVQNQKARNYFPSTSDLGLSLGYKVNDKSSIGVGASYKVGWGRSWDHIRLSHQGIGLRSYVDYKLKGSLYISGGYEQNHRTAFRNVQQLKDLSAWQQSGLLGLSKKYQVSKKLKGDIKLLWDFLSYQQIPRTQAILFRIGYNLK